MVCEASSTRHVSTSSSSGSSIGGSDGKRMRSAVVKVPRNGHRHLLWSLSPPLSCFRKKRSASPPPSQERRRHCQTSSSSPDKESEPSPPPKKKRVEPDPLLTPTGGAYIHPARLRMMQEEIKDKTSMAYQRIAWEALKKSITGLVNKVNVSNIANILQELFQENVVRGRGLLARCVIQAQASSPMFSHVYAAFVAIVNTKFPQTGELVAKRLIIQFRKAFRRNDKSVCIAVVKFLAHLVNQQVLHELVALELLTLLLEEPSDDSVEIAVGFIKECGSKLEEVTPKGLNAVFDTLRSILHSDRVASRVQDMIEVLYAIRKDRFKSHVAVMEELNIVEADDQITHLLSLGDEDLETEDKLNVFQLDPDYVENEERYRLIKEEILGEGFESGSGSEDESEESDEEDESDEEEEEENKMEISDQTGEQERSLRRQIYLTIQSSLDFEECTHKLLKTMGEGHENEIALMLVECCSQERSYMRFFGLIGQRLCLLNQAWVAVFDQAFQDQYDTVHRLETNKLRNVAKFFGQLFYVDALPWTSMACIHLNEEETNSSSRIFIKIMFQELAEFLGLPKLNDKLRDPMLAIAFEGLLPRDNPKNTRFAINFFTSIGLGGLTDDLREHLKNAQKLMLAKKQEVGSPESSSSSSESESSSSEGQSSSSAESSSESSASEERREKGRRKNEKDSVKRSRESERREGNSEKRGSERSKRKRGEDVSGKRRAKTDEGSERRKGKRRNRSSNSDREEERKGSSSDQEVEKTRGRRGGSSDREVERRGRRGDSSDREVERRGRRGGSSDREVEKRRGRRGGSSDREEVEKRHRRRGGSSEVEKRRGRSSDREDEKRRGRSSDRERRGRRGGSSDREDEKRHGRRGESDREDRRRRGRRDEHRDRTHRRKERSD